MKYIYTFITKSGEEIIFRYPTIDDVEILKNYINKISNEKTYIIYQGEQQTLESETKWLNEKLDKIIKKECVYLCAFYNDQLIGSSEITLKDKVKSHIGSFGITIDPGFRGLGIGKKLMELVIFESVKNIPNLKIIELEVFGNNPIAKKMYEKFEFVEFGRMPKGIIHQGKFVDAVLMYKKVK
jgi:hypothetical protein